MNRRARWRTATLAATAVVAALVGSVTTPASAVGTDIKITEFPIGVENYVAPLRPTTGADGNIWSTGGASGAISRITLTGAVTSFTFLNTLFLLDITSGPDGNLWFTDELGNQIGRVTTSGQVTLFPVPLHNDDFFPAGGPLPAEITTGADGNLWFTEVDGNRIARMPPTGQLTEFKIPPDPLGDPTSGPEILFPFGITTGPDGNVWFTEGRFGGGPHIGNKVGRITPQGAITEFPVPTPDAFLFDITPGPDGNLWFTEPGADRIDPSLPAVDKIGRITPQGLITEFQMPVGSNPLGITSGADGNLWVTFQGANAVARVSPQGVLLDQVPTPSAGTFPWGITHGPDGRVWIAEGGARKVGRTQVVGCTDRMSGRISGPLNVTRGALCLSGAQVSGTVNVGPGASLFAGGAQVGGVTSNGANVVRLCGLQVNRPVSVSGTVEELKIGNGRNGCQPNVLGSVNLQGNRSATDVVGGNRITGNLSCTDNVPAPTNGGVPNLVRGARTGQCGGL